MKRDIQDATRLAQTFPLVAKPETHIEIRIHWSDGFITTPYLVDKSYGATFDELYNHCASYKLGLAVLEEEYNRLLQAISPYVECVVTGYRCSGVDTNASFTKSARKAMDKIGSIIEDFDFQYNIPDIVNPTYIYGEDQLWSGMASNTGITAIYYEGCLLLDHSSDDMELMRLVIAEMDNGIEPVNGEELFHFFRELRNDCLQNYKNSNSEV